MNDDTWLPVILAFVATVPGILAYLNQRKKAPAETTDIYTGAAKKLLDTLGERLDKVTARMEGLEASLAKARDDLDAAEEELAKTRAELHSLDNANKRLRNAVGLMLDGIRLLTAQLTEKGVTPAWSPSPALIADLNGISTGK